MSSSEQTNTQLEAIRQLADLVEHQEKEIKELKQEVSQTENNAFRRGRISGFNEALDFIDKHIAETLKTIAYKWQP